MIFVKNNFADVSGEDFVPVMPSSLSGTVQDSLYNEKFTLLGVVQEVLPPSSTKSRSKTQYEYLVAAVGPVSSHKQIRCVLRDSFGDSNDQEYFTLKKGARVIVTCALGDPESGLIIGGLRNQEDPVDEKEGHFWIKRFSQITQKIDKSSTYSVGHDSGNRIEVYKDKIVITDGQNNTLTFDQTEKKITISDGNGESLVFDQQARTVTINAKDLNLNTTGNLTAKVKGEAKIDAKQIKLNGSAGKVVTNNTYPYCYVTGIPIKGIKNVKGG